MSVSHALQELLVLLQELAERVAVALFDRNFRQVQRALEVRVDGDGLLRRRRQRHSRRRLLLLPGTTENEGQMSA